MNELDDLDKAILRSLQQDAKTTTKQLAHMLHISISPIYERIKKLEKLGFIKHYVAILDKKLLNKPITALCQVSMRYHNEACLEIFEKEVLGFEEIQECYLMAGGVDFLLKVNIASLDAYHDFVKYKLSRLDNIGTLNSTFVLKEIKHTHSFII